MTVGGIGGPPPRTAGAAPVVVGVLGGVAVLALCCAGTLIGGGDLEAGETAGAATPQLSPTALLLLGATGVVLGGSIAGVLLLRGRAGARAGRPGAAPAATAIGSGVTALTLCCIGGYLGGVELEQTEAGGDVLRGMPALSYVLLAASGLLAATAVGALAWRLASPPSAGHGRARPRAAAAVSAGAVVSSTLCCLGLIPWGAAQEPGAEELDLMRVPRPSLLLFAAAVLVLGGAVVLATAIRLRPGEEWGPPPPRLATVVSPRGLSRLLFQPRDRYGMDDRLIVRLGFWRTVLAVTTILVLATRGIDSFVFTGLSVLQQGLQVMQVGTLVVLGTAAVAVAVTAGQRRTALRALLRPLATVAGAWLLAGGLYLYQMRVAAPVSDSLLARLEAFPDLESAEPTLSAWFDAAAHLPLLGLGAVWSAHLLWMLSFLFFAIFHLSRYAFRSAEAHPMLPPLIVATTSWCVFLLGSGLLNPVVEAVPSLGVVPLGVSPTLQLVVSAAGTASVTALAAWEIVRIRRRGVTLRRGPWR